MSHIIRRSRHSFVRRSHRRIFVAIAGLAAAIACSDNVVVPYGTPAGLTWVMGPEISHIVDTVGGTFVDTLVIVVEDGIGSQVPGVTVNWSASTGTLNTPSSVTSKGSVKGVFRSAWVIWTHTVPETAQKGTTVGTVTATVAGIPSSVYSAAARLGLLTPVVTAGNSQSGAIHTTLPTPLTIRVTDRHGAPVANQLVTWYATNGTLSATPTTSLPSTDLGTTTDADGTTQVYLTLGPTAGPSTVIVRVPPVVPVSRADSLKTMTSFTATAAP